MEDFLARLRELYGVRPPASTRPRLTVSESRGPVRKQLEVFRQGRDWYVSLTGIPMAVIRGDPRARLGCPSNEEGSRPGELPEYEAKINDFAIGVTEVTWGQYWQFDPTHRPDIYFAPNADEPVTDVSFEMAEKYCRWLSAREGVTYRLPNEDEWEYAARGGCPDSRHFGPALEHLNRYASCLMNGTGALRAPRVASRLPNDYGLYDVLGNVCEWCAPSPHALARGEPPTEMRPGSRPIRWVRERGGAFQATLPSLRSAWRCTVSANDRVFNVGFRVIRPMGDSPAEPRR